MIVLSRHVSLSFVRNEERERKGGVDVSYNVHSFSIVDTMFEGIKMFVVSYKKDTVVFKEGCVLNRWEG